MIRCLLVHISYNQRGQAIRHERQFDCDSLSIGRGAECKLHLPDHRVSLHHATIKHADEGSLFIECEAGHQLEIDGHMVENAMIAQGMRMIAGPYAITVESVNGSESITLAIERVHDEEAIVSPDIPTTLAETGLSMRKPALWMAGMVTLLFLLLPILYTLHPGTYHLAQKLHLALDEPLNAGNMSPGHRALSMKCNTCHQKPFQAVSNQACENCHTAVAHHIADPALYAKVFNDVRCSSCHLDHRGKKGLVRHDSQQCVACHGNIKRKYGETNLNDIHDFSTDHPPFQLTLAAGPEAKEQRIRQTDKTKLVEHSGLKFSHEAHFEKALIELQADQTRDITCTDCHQPDAAGIGFKSMTMAMTCQQSHCHSLQLTPPVAGRVLPHAAVPTVMNSLQEFYASQAIRHTYMPGVTVDDLKRARDWAAAKADENMTYLFTKDEEGTCKECHEVKLSTSKENKKGTWTVAPVHITEHWLPKSRFPHDKHSTAKCTDCHNVMHSEKSADVAIPDVRKCRECHVGSMQAKTRVSSTCDTCHNFHDVRTRDLPPPSNHQTDE